MSIARSLLVAGVALFSLAFPPLTGSQENQAPTAQPLRAWAATRPTGWNSWDCFGTTVTERQTKDNPDFMADKLLRHGWKLITVDIQWYEPNAKAFNYDPNAKFEVDKFGRLQPALNCFPSSKNGAGFKPLATYVHKKKLAFSIHLMRGTPRQAVERNTAIFGTKFRAKDIPNVNDKCPWNPDMFGVDMTKPGAQEYYDSVFGLIANRGVDFFKIDDLSRPCHDHEKEIEAIRKATDKAAAKHKRPIVFSMSPGETALSGAGHTIAHANMSRISDDDLPKTDKWTLSLLTNDEVLVVNQTDTNAREISDNDRLIVWASDAADGKSKYVALFDTRDTQEPLDVTTAAEAVGLREKASVRDLWAGKNLVE